MCWTFFRRFLVGRCHCYLASFQDSSVVVVVFLFLACLWCSRTRYVDVCFPYLAPFAILLMFLFLTQVCGYIVYISQHRVKNQNRH